MNLVMRRPIRPTSDRIKAGRLIASCLLSIWLYPRLYHRLHDGFSQLHEPLRQCPDQTLSKRTVNETDPD